MNRSILGRASAAMLLLSAMVSALHAQDPALLADGTRLNAELANVARSLASALHDAEVREAVREAVAVRFDDDYDVLYKSLANRRLSDGTTLRQRLLAAHPALKGVGISVAEGPGRIDRFTAATPRLQIAVPVGFEAWDPAVTIPLVAYAPVGVDESEIFVIEAFDHLGRVHALDPVLPPEGTVVVVGLNERTDVNGYLNELPLKRCAGGEEPESRAGGPLKCGGGGGGGGSSSCNAGATHAFGDPEILWKLEIGDDYEGWMMGSPEYYIRYVDPSQGQTHDLDLRTDVPEDNQLYTVSRTLFTWTSPSANQFEIEFWEDDGSFGFGGDDDFITAIDVPFSAANCQKFDSGDVDLWMRFK